MKLVFLLLVSAAVIFASPSDNWDESSEPTEAVQIDINQDAIASEFSFTQVEAKALGSTDACRKVADNAEKAVRNAFKTEQDTVDKTSSTKLCAVATRVSIVNAKNAMDRAKIKRDSLYKAWQNLEAAKKKELIKTITFNGWTFDKIHSNIAKSKACKFHVSEIFSQRHWKAAWGAVSGAKVAYQTADKQWKTRVTEYAKAPRLAATAQAKCRCDVKDRNTKAVADANKSLKEGQSASWRKAYHLRCVLDKTTFENCKVPDLPKIKSKTTHIGCTNGAIADWVGDFLKTKMWLEWLKPAEGVAMVVNGASSLLRYNSHHWTSSSTGDLGHGNKKTALFMKRAKYVYMHFNTGGHKRTIGPIPMWGKSLQELFKGGFRGIGVGIGHWRGAGGGARFGWQHHCNRQGYNNKPTRGNTNCRLCLIMNQERDCRSPDSAIGVGFQNGARITAGGRASCCCNGGHCRRMASTVTLVIKQK